MRTCFACVTVVLLQGAAYCEPPGLGEYQGNLRVTIRAGEVGHSVRVLGRLGQPLRSVATVSGVWVEMSDEPKPGSSLRFHVDEVDGQRLDKPVEFRVLDLIVVGSDGKAIEAAKGERWTLRAYETWPDYGHPAEFYEELGIPPHSPAARSPTRMIGVLKRRAEK